MSYEVFYVLANASFVLNLVFVAVTTAIIWRQLDYTMKSKATPKEVDWNELRERKDRVW
jgi:hypothetical protein